MMWQGGETLLVMSSSHFRLDEEESWPSLPRRTTIFKFRRGKEQVNPLVMSKKTCYQLLPTTTTTTTEQRGQGMGAHPRYLVRFFYTYSIVPITNYTKLFADTTTWQGETPLVASNTNFRLEKEAFTLMSKQTPPHHLCLRFDAAFASEGNLPFNTARVKSPPENAWLGLLFCCFLVHLDSSVCSK